MYPYENALLIAGSYFFLILLTVPGLVGWWYQNYLDKRGEKSAPRVIPISDTLGSPPRAA